MPSSYSSAADFVIGQTIKTIRNPRRLIVVPVGMVRRLLGRLLSRFLDLIVRIVAAASPSGEFVPRYLQNHVAQREFDAASKILHENKPEEAWDGFVRCLKYSRDAYHYRVAAVCLQVGLGRAREAIALHRQSDKVRMLRRADMRGAATKYRVLDSFWTGHIGHAAQIDYVIKFGILEGWNAYDTILYADPNAKMANRFLVEQWAPHLRHVTSARDLPFSVSALEKYALNFYVPPLGKGNFYLWEVAAQTYRRWHQQRRQPLLALPPDIEAEGRKTLTRAGVPADSWFVTLHVRDPQFQPYHRELHYVLNAKISDYVPAIQEITRRGGWLIRMGDAGMPPLPPMENVLDYCHSSMRSDWMDVFLAARCRFFVGTSSGVCYVAQAYGVPCVLTNWWPPAQRPWHPGDIFIPKLHRRISTGEELTLEQSLREPFGYCNSLDYLQERLGITVDDNDPEDIRAAVVEMLDRVSGQAHYDEQDLALRTQSERIYARVATELYESTGAFGAASLARGFLRRKAELLAS